MSKLLLPQLLILIVLVAFTNSQRTRNRLPTTHFCPRNIWVRLRDLPQPYATESASKSPQTVPKPAHAQLNVPRGFRVNTYLSGLDNPRWLALTPTGDTLVTETYLNQIRVLRDTDGDGVADVNEIFAGPENGLNQPFGMAFSEGFFYLGNTNEVKRYPYNNGDRRIEGTGERIAELPEGGHWTRNVKVSPDGTKLYVAIGSAANVEEEEAPRASVLVMNLDGTDSQTFASGLRNPVGMGFRPGTDDLYVVVNERDALGDDLVPDYFTRIQQGDFFGWPYAYLSPDNIDPRMTNPDGSSLNPELAAQTKTPDVLFQAHSANIGLEFYTGSTFPRGYRHGAFVALRGSWNRNSGTGYKVVYVPFGKKNRPLGFYQDFLTGFMVDPTIPSVWGRPVGLLTLPDGSLVFTDEVGGNIYRIQYQR